MTRTYEEAERICPGCGQNINEKNHENALESCCSDQWIKQQIDLCYS